jgi:hypothetical protein
MINRRLSVREEKETTMKNPSRSYKPKTRKCVLCRCVYEEKYGVPFGEVWICGDCLGTIPIKDLPKILSRMEMVSNNG